MDPEISVNADGTISVRMSGTFTADDVRRAIEQLCQARAQVAQDPTSPEGQRVLLAEDAPWFSAPHGDRSNFLLRVPGLGWVGTLLSRSDGLRLAHYLVGHQVNVVAAATASPAGDTQPQLAPTGGGGHLH
ncbi:MAG: hypothetical protein RI988_3821 [Pseudomonadota bacterium]|jgi:hypothetical protein